MSNSQLLRTKEFIRKISEGYGVSGYEFSLAPLVIEKFRELAEEVRTDRFGNVYSLKKGTSRRYKVMLAAHMDEIGLMVKEIDQTGFVRFTTVGGVDPRTLVGQEVIIHGREDILGVIGAIPPHLQMGEGEHAFKIEDLGIDVGISFSKACSLIQIGDTVTLSRQGHELFNNLLAGKSFDDRAGVAVMAVCLEELDSLYHLHDVIAVTTAQEEVGIRGALTSAYTINPDLAIAIDVTHGSTPDTKGVVNIELGKGPAVALGPNIHPAIYKGLTETAREHRLPYQPEPIPGASGTDAWAIQVTQAGVPTGLVSIPLRYMHTSVETLDLNDVVNSGKLLAYFIASLPEELEAYLCY